MKFDAIAYIVMSLIGFFVGGVIQLFIDGTWQPGCWIGMLAVFGIPIVSNICD